MTRMKWVAAGVASVAVVAAVAAGLQGGGGGGDDAALMGDSAGGGDAVARESFTEGGAPQDTVAAATDGAYSASLRTSGGGTSTLELQIEPAAVIRTGSLALRTPDILKAQNAISGLLSSLDGYLASENTQAGPDGEIRSATLVLKVPSSSFDVAMSRLSQVGDVQARTQSAKDVTRQVAEVDSRVASARAALERIRLLLDRANSLGTVIRLESVLSSRQAELESLLAQQKTLAAQTQMSTIDVNLTVPRPPAPPPPPEEDDRGFVSGLQKGWDAFTTMVLAVATATGAVLPFAVLLVLLGVPAWLLVRRVRSQPRPDVAQAG